MDVAGRFQGGLDGEAAEVLKESVVEGSTLLVCGIRVCRTTAQKPAVFVELKHIICVCKKVNEVIPVSVTNEQLIHQILFNFAGY